MKEIRRDDNNVNYCHIRVLRAPDIPVYLESWCQSRKGLEFSADCVMATVMCGWHAKASK